MNQITRRRFLKASLAASACATIRVRAQSDQPLGQGQFRYRVVPNWGMLGPQTPVNNCHGLVRDKEGHIILLTDHVKNNVIIYDKQGRLINKWGTKFPGAHGLSLVTEGARQVLYITDLQLHKFFKTTLEGEILNEWGWPKDSRKYGNEEEFRPSWTLHFANGEFFVLDGYGKDYICHFTRDGKFQAIFGGPEGGIAHWGPHGGIAYVRNSAMPELIVAMSDQQHLLRLLPNGKKLGQTELPGGNPRQIRLHKGHFYVAHLADNWPKDQKSRGFLSVLTPELKVLSNIAGTAPIYNEAGKLARMKSQEPVFMHPHDLIVDDEDSIYVAQFASGNTYPVKLERV
jgi:hypothetical protein